MGLKQQRTFHFVAQVDPWDFAHEMAANMALGEEKEVRNAAHPEARSYLRVQGDVERGKRDPVAVHLDGLLERGREDAARPAIRPPEDHGHWARRRDDDALEVVGVRRNQSAHYGRWAHGCYSEQWPRTGRPGDSRHSRCNAPIR